MFVNEDARLYKIALRASAIDRVHIDVHLQTMIEPIHPLNFEIGVQRRVLKDPMTT
jgi:hypothetical protein